jgi:hypothetical protein
VIEASLADLRSRLYEGYASLHTGGGDEAAALDYRRDTRPAASAIADIGCSRGDLVRLLQRTGGVRVSLHDARAHCGPENPA